MTKIMDDVPESYLPKGESVAAKEMSKGLYHWEEGGEYWIRVDLNLNRMVYNFYGRFRKKEDIPNYLEFTRQALEKLKPGYTCLCWTTTKVMPSIAIFPEFKKGFELYKEKEYGRIAAFYANRFQATIVGSLRRLFPIEISVFKDQEKALAYLDNKDEK